MDQFVERLFASDTECQDTGTAAGRKVSTCGSQRPALLQADAHKQLVPLLSSMHLRVEHTVVAPRLLQSVPQTLLQIPYGARGCLPERHRCLQNARNHIKV